MTLCVHKMLAHTVSNKNLFKTISSRLLQNRSFCLIFLRADKKRPSKSTGNALKSSTRAAPAGHRQLNFFAISRQRKLEICVPAYIYGRLPASAKFYQLKYR